MVGMDGYLRNLTDADLMDFSLPSWLEIWDLLRSAELIQLTHVDSWVEKHWEALNILNPLVQPYTRGKHAKKNESVIQFHNGFTLHPPQQVSREGPPSSKMVKSWPSWMPGWWPSMEWPRSSTKSPGRCIDPITGASFGLVWPWHAFIHVSQNKLNDGNKTTWG